ncbi:hypothetical protein [Montanilutibacter psychrotolerans]|uniref:Secreted protein n=1 Tax=Montanilutibacter psychrotolerans TaxID=1327343 RepID=A0A3M8SVQ3_9GAMM|nr:hypothetical protein [Lysobacter psychrotolerans]RNF85411.1 hypothetical protein EER27_06545 [Lysobacter psychrotolerans]
MSVKANSLAVLGAVVLAVTLSACGGGNDLDLNSAQAQAEREEEAKHFDNMKYAEVKPIGAEEAKPAPEKPSEPAEGAAAK